MAKPIYTMPERQPHDEGISVERCKDGSLAIHAEGVGMLVVSEFNAVRLLGMLSVFLKVPLDKRYAKEIKL